MDKENLKTILIGNFKIQFYKNTDGDVFYIVDDKKRFL